MKTLPVTGKRPVDVIKFTIKSKDTDAFLDKTMPDINANLIRKKKTAGIILENPRYNEFEEHFEKLQYGSWAAQNLKNTKGYDVAIPKAENPDGDYDIYLVLSDKANKQSDKKFGGLRGFLNFAVDVLKATATTNRFSRQVGGAGNDIHYSDAAQFLYEHEVNKHQHNRFQKYLSKLNVKTVEYKPPKSFDTKG
jgi:hypothetical protein